VLVKIIIIHGTSEVLVKLGFCSSEGWDIVTLTHINTIVNED